ncbi:hypothetical protein PC129_g2732 [Phytophthora cactorum]|uniref:Uncharacterized protein n=1 Tax=Phytophthora cactorum TaxID=29920 RepID=A0A329T1Y2_9STRA|nr:hypothetical protein Pcac1_g17633 [Phytophthora cactorum]KAG2845231.1 hypothetical protein PC112_g1891 [Phytophthora cactorum]KAG2846091.1 hypothetical protein PC111_g1297 [Phytophthora cactorum]KAG2867298.1 hypothetical protein PC113_g2065 [Phytophthora cactorum]KAG2930760.1 hypothetical protein PC114_g2348 [Phytophthora cactorum]
MIEVEGDAAFKSFPGENFRFGVEHADGVGEIWLESQSSKKRWSCEVTDVAAFAPVDVVLPQKTVLHYVAASLRESAAANYSNLGPKLVREGEDETLQLEVLIKLGVADFAWAPKYIFPMTLVAPSLSPTEAQAEQITLLTSQVQDLQQEVKTLKQQMQTVLQAHAASHPARPAELVAATRISPAPVAPGTVVVVENRSTVSTPSRGDQVWGDIIGHSHHELVQTGEYRETRNSLGVTIRSHRQHTCKVCSVLRGDRKRAAQSSYYCRECTERHDGGMVFLCDKARPHDPKEYRNATCSQIWHLMWNNGESIPQTGTSSIRMRKKLKTDSE